MLWVYLFLRRLSGGSGGEKTSRNSSYIGSMMIEALMKFQTWRQLYYVKV